MPRGKRKIKDVSEMSCDQMAIEMTDIITKDILKFVETVVRKRVSLFVKEIQKGIVK